MARMAPAAAARFVLTKIIAMLLSAVVVEPGGCNTKKYKISNMDQSQKNHWTQASYLYNMQGHGLAVENTRTLCDRDGGG